MGKTDFSPGRGGGWLIANPSNLYLFFEVSYLNFAVFFSFLVDVYMGFSGMLGGFYEFCGFYWDYQSLRLLGWCIFAFFM